MMTAKPPPQPHSHRHAMCFLLLLLCVGVVWFGCDVPRPLGEESMVDASDGSQGRDQAATQELPPDGTFPLPEPSISADRAPEPSGADEPSDEPDARDAGSAVPGSPPVPESTTEPRCPAGQQPEAEVCDGKDNDCDGQIDEDLVGCVGTLAGTGLLGARDGRGTAASLNTPSALAIGPKGHLWITDTKNHVIRRLDRSTNQLTTYAGTGQPGHKDGPIDQAQFDHPGAIAIASNGDIYVADTVSHSIRKISQGQVTTIAGGLPGLADGQGTAARFYFPSGIAYDEARKIIYVADTLNHCLRKIDAAGAVSIFAGSCEKGFANGQGKAAQFFFPIAIAISAQGDVYVADGSNNMIRKVSPSGYVSIMAGQGQRGYRDGAAHVALFYHPPGVTVAQDGSVYVADAPNQRIRRIAPDGQVTTVAGAGPIGHKDGPALKALFSGPTGIIAAHDRLYISDLNSHTIRMLRLR